MPRTVFSVYEQQSLPHSSRLQPANIVLYLSRSATQIIIIILMTREAGVAYKSRKYGLCTLKAVCTNLAKKFTAAVLLDANKYICP